jgi:hypothetical protein
MGDLLIFQEWLSDLSIKAAIRVRVKAVHTCYHEKTKASLSEHGMLRLERKWKTKISPECEIGPSILTEAEF